MLKSALRWFLATLSPSRWALAMGGIAFCSTVSLYRFVDSAGLLAIRFTAPEMMQMILESPVNAAFIYLPLYLFLVCGLTQDPGIGAQAALGCGSRRRFARLLICRLGVVTLLFFVLLTGETLLVAGNLGPWSALWSEDYLAYQVLHGAHPLRFALPPAAAIGLQLLCRMLGYWLAGCTALLVGRIFRREALALFLGLVAGLPVNLLDPARFGARFLGGGLLLCAALLLASAGLIRGLYAHLLRADLGEAPV